MTKSPDFALTEAGSAQLQALTTLSALGWRYISRAEADKLRGHRRSHVILDAVVVKHLSRINRIRRDDRSFPFSEANVRDAINRLTDVRFDGLLATNEQLTDLLQLGISVQQTVEGTTRGWPLSYIDWQDWRANDFAMTAECSAAWEGGEAIRADIVLFVNGIPWVIIEVKNSRVETEQGISQQLRNQKPDQGAPNLFFTTQLLIAGNASHPRYATVGTPAKLWSTWTEREDKPEWVAEVMNRTIDPIEQAAIYSDFAAHQRRHRGLMESGGRMGTPLDEMLIHLCRPERLLDLARRFTLFDGPFKKVARYQQVFTVKSLLKRIETKDAAGRRAGGVVWHTQGSGKSLTMVMMAKALAMAVPAARLVLVTDRVDLNSQLTKTFRATGLAPEAAKTGEHLLELIDARAPIVTTVIHKFKAGLNKRKVVDRSADIFVLVDESHRSQYGDLDSLHEKMRSILPNACFIGFTGTPIAKRERNTFLKFGELVQPVYSMRTAVQDKAVVPLLYEGRHIEEDVDDNAIDTWFDRVTRDLTDKQRTDLKKKMSRPRQMMGISSRLKCIAFDVSEHFEKNFKGTGLKAQLVAPSKRDAVALKGLLDEFGLVTSEVVISGPDAREHESDILEETTDEVKKFWARMMTLYKSEEEYNRQIIDRFKGPEDPEILIVVSKLLTGFDAPRNTVLYLAKPMREHDLLQAIARVNRVFDEDGAPEKPFGYVIDYSGVLKDLGKALSSYEALMAFDADDIAGTIASISDESKSLPEKHAALLDLFSGVSNKFDEEAYARTLADVSRREEFYARFSAFKRAYEVACVSREFVETTDRRHLDRWRSDNARFQALRDHVRMRYADAVDFKDYERKVRRLLDEHVTAHRVTTVIAPLNIFDDAAIEAARKEKKRSDASIADEIAHRLQRTLQEKWEQDPVFYEKFSELVRRTIADFNARRLEEKAYLARVKELRDKFEAREDDEDPVPPKVHGNGHATAFWRLVRRAFGDKAEAHSDLAADLALKAIAIIEGRARVGWQNDRDIENEIRNDFDDYYFDELREQASWLDHTVMDIIVGDVLASARVRMAK